MDQWNLRTAAAHMSQYTQQSGQGGSAQYSYNSSAYGNNQQQQQQQQPQQPQPSSAASAAYNPQAYLQQTVGYGGGNAAYGGQQQQQQQQQQLWSQRPQTDQSQAGYGGSNRVTAAQVPSTGVTSGNQYAGQYGGVYGVSQQPQQQQQLLGVGSKAADYQGSGAVSRNSSAYGGGGGGVQDRPVASGASYVAGGVSSVYGAAESGKYLTNPGYVGKGVDYASANQYNNQKTSADQYMSAASSYVKPDNYASQVYEQLQQVARAAATGSQDMSARGVLANTGYGTSTADASGLLASLGGAGGLTGGGLSQNNAYGGGGNRGMTGGQVYPVSPTLGYGGVSLPPGRDYGTGRVSGGGSLFQREGSFGRDRPSIGSSRFDDRERERERKREERERERERERDREREREQREIERRERERERERREEERRRERTPPRVRRELSPPPPPVRRDEKIKRESPRRHASPSKDKRREYLCKIDPANLLEAERDCNSITRRYTRLTVVPEFTKYVISWMGMEDKVPLENSLSFEHDSVDVEDEPESAPKSNDKQKAPVVWHVKVLLMSGLTEECVGELLSDKAADKPTNLHKLIKFVALRRDRNAIMAAGGRWDKSLDGGDPAADDNALIRTGVRCLKELVQLDLSECKTWIRFGEIHYDRVDSDGLPSHKDISVLLLPDLSSCVPSVENWCLQWSQRKQAKLDRETAAKKESTPADKEGEKESANGVEKPEEAAAPKDEKKEDKEDKKEDEKKEKEEAPPEPGFVLVAKRSKSSKLRSMTISLDGLLDYDENDKDECTFELSLFAEAFAEMLQFRKGSQILSSLEALRKASLIRKREDKKRIRQAEPGKEQDAKRSKAEAVKPSDEAPKPTSSGPTDEPQEEPKTAEKEGTESELKPSATPTTPEAEAEDKDEAGKKEKNGSGKKEKEKKEKNVVVDKELLKAYRYFDRNKTGYIKAEDLKKLLHSLGKFLSSKHVKDLVNCAVVESGKLRDDKIVYRNLTDREVSL